MLYLAGRNQQKAVSALVLLAGAIAAWAQPAFLFHPTSASVSTRANLALFGMAYGSEPITYQWYKDGMELAGQTDLFLVLFDIRLEDAGFYSVVATSPAGSATSEVATLTVNATFSKVTTGSLVNSGGTSWGAAAGDYDGDGFLDLFVAKAGTEFNHLYRNNGDGSFSRVEAGVIANEITSSFTACWADYDNDGLLDLFVANSADPPIIENNSLFRNRGNGAFQKVTNSVSQEGSTSICSAWADYDSDGFLDLFIGNQSGRNFLYRNNRDGSFAKITTGSVVADTLKLTVSSAWADFDNDRDPDLLVANAIVGSQHEYLFRNDGDGSFLKIASGPVVASGGNSYACAWADFDNDLDLDVFIANNAGQHDFLFANNGDGTFIAVTEGPILDDGADSVSATWGDFDNDGWLDLFVVCQAQKNLFYRNNGNGTFSQIDVGSPVSDVGMPGHCLSADFDNNGFLDIFVTNVGGNNSLYRNNGNSNNWISIQCVGTGSNRSAVGAKVKVRARIRSVDRWQMREIASRDATGSPNSLRAEFGLGDATNIDLIRIEWPSGVIQELAGVSVNQFLNVVESPSLRIDDASIAEGDGGESTMRFKISLTGPTKDPVTVEFLTADGSATASLDYVRTNGTVLFGPGETNQVVYIPILGDLLDETNETFSVLLTNATTVPISFARASGRILDDDPLVLSVNNVAVSEGDSGSSVAMLTLKLVKPVDHSVTVNFGTVNGSAVASIDFVTTNGSVTFDPGETEKYIGVPILGDTLDEANEVVFLNLSNLMGATFLNSQGAITIVDDDPFPTLAVSSVSLPEGDAGTNHALFRFDLSAASARLITFSYSTVSGSAIAGSDFFPKSGSLSFTAGKTSEVVAVVVNGDTIPEPNEMFAVHLSNPVSVVFSTNHAFCTILDDDLKILAVMRREDCIRLRFPTIADQIYRLEWKSDLDSAAEWTVIDGQSFRGTGAIMEVACEISIANPQRFYRLVRLDSQH